MRGSKSKKERERERWRREKNLCLPEKSILTLARVALSGDGEARGTSASEAAHDVVARVRAGRLQGALVFI